MKHLLIIALVLLGSVATSCKKTYVCTTTAYATDPSNNWSSVMVEDDFVSKTDKDGLQAYKTKQEKIFNTQAIYVITECEVYK